MALLAVPPLRAQIVNDGATRTLLNETNSFPGDVIIGTNNPFTLLVISDNALLTNSANGIIGLDFGAKSNEVRLISPTARWLMGGSLIVSSNGAFNRLTISNGARVQSLGAALGGFRFFSSNNEVVVTGPGSLWTNSGLSIGVVSPGNRLLISNGGRVSSGGSSLGYYGFADNNTATVTGAGSTWNNQSTLEIGRDGTNCSLVISNSAFVDNTVGTICSGFSGSNSEVVVTGPGSVWSNRTSLTVGESGNRARLVVTNGGSVFSLGDVVLGAGFSSTNNRIIVAGGKLRATNAASTATLDLRRGTNQFDSGVIEAGVFRMTNTLGFFEFNGGTLITRGAVISNGTPFVVGRSGTTPAVWDVRAGLSDHFLSSDLQVGLNGAANQLTLSNGGVVRTRVSDVGIVATSSNNVAVVTGSGSVLSNALELVFGFGSAGNQLVISNGGMVLNGVGYLGNDAASINNIAVVTDPGSVWTNGSVLNVGYNGGSGNQLRISNGGRVVNSDGIVGFSAASRSNSVLVTGNGSTWNNLTNLIVGRSGDANQLAASNGAIVFVGGNGVLGGNSTASSNSVAVTDPGTSWLVTSNVYVGSNGAFNLLVVSNGGRVVGSMNGIVGNNASSSNNTVMVTGAQSLWSNFFNVNIGSSGSGNRLVVENGGLAANDDSGFVGASGSRNEALVTGLGSRWNNSPELYVGYIGTDNQLVVSNGAAVQDLIGYVGHDSFSSNNVAVVTGSGSVWSNATELYIGRFGSRNRLVVTNGGMVFAGSNLFVGESITSGSNRVVVEGGTLLVTNGLGTARLDVRRGTNVLNAGLVEVDQLLLTNFAGFFEFNAGTFSARNSRVSNVTFFRVGNGVSAATFNLKGNGLHEFIGTAILSVSANATLTGNGTISGNLFVLRGGTLSPGASVGKLVLSNSPSLQGTVVMEISRNGVTLTNDQIQVVGPLTYGGSLTVSDLGPTALAIGDRFPLFSATSYAGGFTNIILPPLAAGLGWTNKLLVDGSIEVIGVPLPVFASITLSGTDVIISGTNGPPNAPYAVLTATNVTTPLSNWVSLVTNQFDSSGNFSFTNPIVPGELQRYFRIRTP